MKFIRDLLPIFKNHEISFKERYKEGVDIVTFIFQTDKPIDWKSGQHGIFNITHKKINKPTRPFSIASTPQEGNIKISMKVNENPSEFKKTLMNLEPGMIINMRGPIGSFYIDDNRPSLFIAGGIGITPYRAILKDIEANKREKPHYVKLLYMDSSKNYIYKDELDGMHNDSSIVIKYLDKREELNDEMDKFISEYGNNGNYFVVGSSKMTKAIIESLKQKNIKNKNIRKDTFIGY